MNEIETQCLARAVVKAKLKFNPGSCSRAATRSASRSLSRS